MYPERFFLEEFLVKCLTESQRFFEKICVEICGGSLGWIFVPHQTFRKNPLRSLLRIFWKIFRKSSKQNLRRNNFRKLRRNPWSFLKKKNLLEFQKQFLTIFAENFEWTFQRFSWRICEGIPGLISGGILGDISTRIPGKKL